MKKLLIIIFSMWGICSTAQKVRNVIAKDGETINVKIAPGTSNKVQINGKLIYTQGLQILPPPPPKVLYLKDFADWRVAYHTAITQGMALQGETMDIQTDCIPSDHIPFDGDLTVQGTAEKPLVITCNFREGIDRDVYSLYFGSGKKHFKNVIFKKIGSNPFAGCIQTTQADITYHNTFENCKWEGDWRFNYQSTMGHGSSTFINCNMFAIINNIQYYSQLGSKDLIIKNTFVKSIESHNIYSHSWNNYYIDGLTSTGCGKNAFNSYFTNNTGNFKSTYQSFKNCKNSPEALSKQTNAAPMWRLQSVGCRISVENSDLPVYEWNRDLDLVNTNTSNKGNGTPIYGNSAALNSTGDLTAMDTLTIVTSNLTNLIGWHNSSITAISTTVKFTTLKPGNYLFKNCDLGDIELQGDGVKVTFENCKFNSQYKAIRVFKGDSEGIKFIGNSYPILSY